MRAIDGFSRAVLEEYGEALDERARRYLQRVRMGTEKMSGEMMADPKMSDGKMSDEKMMDK